MPLTRACSLANIHTLSLTHTYTHTHTNLYSHEEVHRFFCKRSSSKHVCYNKTPIIFCPSHSKNMNSPIMGDLLRFCICECIGCICFESKTAVVAILITSLSLKSVFSHFFGENDDFVAFFEVQSSLRREKTFFRKSMLCFEIFVLKNWEFSKNRIWFPSWA